MFNNFTNMPYIPYNIIAYLVQNSKAENFWKLLYYPNYNALSQPNLTMAQKSSLIWKNQDRQENYNIYLTYLVSNMQLDAKTVLKLYQYENNPINKIKSTLNYEFDILMGAKIAMVDYNGIPCNRAEAIEAEVLNCLNGADVAGAGLLQFNADLDGGHIAKSRFNIGNNSTFTGISFIMSVQWVGVRNDTECS